MMELSSFEKLVLSAIIQGDADEATLAEQIRSARVEQRDYTGVGLFTKLVVDPRTPRSEPPQRYVEEIPRTQLAHPALPAGAGVILWISDGRADTLECFTYEGDWPDDESRFSVSR